uniref:Uncharacterized protein n=1 Tax=Pongo abelii TaxID=9601 RepID=A0A8I5YPQ4_PONAB
MVYMTRRSHTAAGPGPDPAPAPGLALNGRRALRGGGGPATRPRPLKGPHGLWLTPDTRRRRCLGPLGNWQAGAEPAATPPQPPAAGGQGGRGALLPGKAVAAWRLGESRGTALRLLAARTQGPCGVSGDVRAGSSEPQGPPLTGAGGEPVLGVPVLGASLCWRSLCWGDPCTGGVPVPGWGALCCGPCAGGIPVLGALCWGIPVLGDPCAGGLCAGGIPVLGGPCAGGIPVLRALCWGHPCAGASLCWGPCAGGIPVLGGPVLGGLCAGEIPVLGGPVLGGALCWGDPCAGGAILCCGSLYWGLCATGGICAGGSVLRDSVLGASVLGSSVQRLEARIYHSYLGSLSQGACGGLGQCEGSPLAWVLGLGLRREKGAHPPDLGRDMMPWESPFHPRSQNPGCTLPHVLAPRLRCTQRPDVCLFGPWGSCTCPTDVSVAGQVSLTQASITIISVQSG